MQILKSLSNFFRNIFRFRDKKKTTFKTDRVNIYIAQYMLSRPDKNKIKDNVVYIIGENNNYWLAMFKCPCGCNDIIQLNLLNDSSPSWKISSKPYSKISIKPSIERVVGCKSHFTLTKGRIEYVNG